MLLGAVLALAGCAGVGQNADREVAADPCEQRLRALEERAASRGIDPGDPRAVPAFPELATNRVLASFSSTSLRGREFDDWVGRLAEAGARRRAVLVTAMASDAGGRATGPDSPQAAALEACASRLLASRRWDAGERQALDRAIAVTDDYLPAHRALGLYPITSFAARIGIHGLHRQVRETFATPLRDLPRAGTLEHFVPDPAPPGTRPALPPGLSDSLGVRAARLEASVLSALLAHHAPVLEVDVAGSDDRPGRPYLDASGVGAVNTAEPLAYSYVRVMPFDGELRLQLVYVFWFDARPRRGPVDTLAGDVDGLVWRVTLDRSGRPLLYDSIHPCGCYHQFFPSDELLLRTQALDRPEPPLVPAAAPRVQAGERIVLRIESGTHYLQRVYTTRTAADAAVTRYALRPYRDLFRVRASGTHGSFFAKHGLVPGTQRPERFYLWPMGVRSPGAMRDRGRQATAFVGRRHFDDADLLDSVFLRSAESAMRSSRPAREGRE